MKIVVCIKPVKTELVYPNEDRNETFVMNPYDLYALESCLALKKEIDCQIVCLCMGAKAAEDMLIKALAMGADEVVLLSDGAFGGSDTVATTYILAKGIEKIGKVDLIVCGEKTIDGETGQITYGLGERLKCPCLSKTKKFIEVDEKGMVLQKQENEFMVTVHFKLPAIISFDEITLRQPNISLIALKKAKRKEITIWGAHEINADLKRCGTSGSKTKVLNVKSEFVKRETVHIDGGITDEAKLILDMVNVKIN